MRGLMAKPFLWGFSFGRPEVCPRIFDSLSVEFALFSPKLPESYVAFFFQMKDPLKDLSLSRMIFLDLPPVYFPPKNVPPWKSSLPPKSSSSPLSDTSRSPDVPLSRPFL